MGERGQPKKARDHAAMVAPRGARDPDDAERLLGRIVAAGLPMATVAGALVAGFVASLGSALLVLASGALLGTIALLWTSLRTLGGDAPLPSGMQGLAARRRGYSELGERKGRVLRALKDLESEHAIGKIDDTDYQTFVARYREDAKAVMREMDLEVEPARAEAERIAREYLATERLAPGVAPGNPRSTSEQATGRRGCTACSMSNEADAAFCKRCGAAMARANAKATKSGDAPS